MPKAEKITTRPEKTKTKVRTKTKETVPEVAAFDPNDVYGDVFDSVAKEYNLDAVELSTPNKLSSNYLVLDFMTAGGISSGTMQILSGEEHSGKSTSFLEIQGQALEKDVAFSIFNDIEGALVDEVYAGKLLGAKGNDFMHNRLRSAKVTRERLIENYFNSAKKMLDRLPDKLYRSDRKAWFYVFDATKDGRAMMAKWGFTKYDRELYSLTGRLFCETDRKGLQGLLICDSFTAMSPKQIDDKDNAGRAADARAFSENLKKVIGLLQIKSFSLLASQQTRTKPDATYSGIPELYESQGDAIKFLSSNRIRFLNRSVPVAKNAGIDFEKSMGENGYPDSKVGGEKSYYGPQEDFYSYALMKNIKNRFGIPRMEAMNRVLFKDGAGVAHGHCKVFDTWIYLVKTGRVERVRAKGKKQAFQINLEETRGKVFDWFEFKGFITANTDPSMKKSITAGMGGTKIPDIRPQLFKEIRKKECYKLMSRKTKMVESEDVDLEA
jgi:hypothetical protein